MIDEAFLARLVPPGASLPEVPGATAVVGFAAAEARSEVPPHHLELVDGRLVAAGLGTHPEVTLSVVLAGADLCSWWAGEIPLDVAYMQGRAKVTGRTGVLLAVLEVWRSEAWAGLVAGARA